MGEGNGSDEDMDAETDELLGDHGEKEDAQSEDEEGDSQEEEDEEVDEHESDAEEEDDHKKAEELSRTVFVRNIPFRYVRLIHANPLL